MFLKKNYHNSIFKDFFRRLKITEIRIFGISLFWVKCNNLFRKTELSDQNFKITKILRNTQKNIICSKKTNTNLKIEISVIFRIQILKIFFENPRIFQIFLKFRKMQKKSKSVLAILRQGTTPKTCLGPKFGLVLVNWEMDFDENDFS